jgi:hypothetical protein
MNQTPRKSTVRVIRADRSGHFAGEMAVEEFKTYAWEARREAVVINGIQVDTFEDFLRAVDACPQDTPEVLFFPPLAGGA